MNAGAFGLDAKCVDREFIISVIVSGSPAARGGLNLGDIITAINGKETRNMSEAEFHDALRKHPGEALTLAYLHGSQNLRVTITAVSRLSLNPEVAREANYPPAVTQQSSNWSVTVALGQTKHTPSSLFLWLQIANKSNSPAMKIDVGKCFVIDSAKEQLLEVTSEQMKYAIQQWVAQNWHGGIYVAPHKPEQRAYRVTATSTNSYFITDIGSGSHTVTSAGNAHATASEQDAQLSSAFGLPTLHWNDRKYDKTLLEDVRKEIENIDQITFQSDPPLSPGEIRSGAIGYWSGSPRALQSPFKVILFVADPNSKKEQTLIFEFH